MWTWRDANTQSRNYPNNCFLTNLESSLHSWGEQFKKGLHSHMPVSARIFPTIWNLRENTLHTFNTHHQLIIGTCSRTIAMGVWLVCCWGRQPRLPGFQTIPSRTIGPPLSPSHVWPHPSALVKWPGILNFLSEMAMKWPQSPNSIPANHYPISDNLLLNKAHIFNFLKSLISISGEKCSRKNNFISLLLWNLVAPHSKTRERQRQAESVRERERWEGYLCG